ncbi:hypothetical protein IWX64_003151 [Arthrobacter sp. CAN_A212]
MNLRTLDQSVALDESEQQLARLESVRTHLVGTVLGMLVTCTSPTLTCEPGTPLSIDRQRLLSAAIGDLQDLDDQLHQARNPLKYQH